MVWAKYSLTTKVLGPSGYVNENQPKRPLVFVLVGSSGRLSSHESSASLRLHVLLQRRPLKRTRSAFGVGRASAFLEGAANSWAGVRDCSGKILV